MLHYHGQVLREYRVAKVVHAASVPAWLDALKVSAQLCRDWLKASQVVGATRRPYGVLHVTNTDRRAFANVETP